jgi:hypothetical protein
MLLCAAFIAVKKNKGKLEMLKQKFMNSHLCSLLCTCLQLILLFLVVGVGYMVLSFFFMGFYHGFTFLPVLALTAFVVRLVWWSFCLVRTAHGINKKLAQEVNLFGREDYDTFGVWADIENPYEIPSFADQVQTEVNPPGKIPCQDAETFTESAVGD